ncbi:zinc transporter ZIP1-like [Amphibalanus amphitrite]|uniref:zinc transporter ZIP1-like n=1 Tax=Amphibalanus amphitrite TaxID=1232801 RepID=UPI001C8FCD9D|nr:zinc transporter ZIP1-like [Amphibalanus amphitrite]
MDEALQAKLVSLAVLGLGSLAAGCLPMAALAIVRRGKRGRDATLRVTADSTLFSYLLCFGGGVLLSTLLCHMIPESLESWDDLQADQLVVENDVPLPSILTGVGFFLVYAVEEVAHAIMHGRRRPGAAKVTPQVELSELSAVELQRRAPQPAAADEPHSHGAEEPHSHGAALAESASALSTVLLLVALSFHAVLEGIAVGAEEEANDVYLMLAAICSHKFVLVFILGLELLATRLQPAAQLGCILTFVGATLLGIGIGIGVLQLDADGRAHGISLMVLQTLSAGALMFVCFMEVLSRERSRHGHKLARLACTAFGFALIALLVSLVTEPEED